MPCCVGDKCAGEFLHSQVGFGLSDSNATKYAAICRKKLDEIDDEKDATKRETKRILAAFTAEARTKLTVMSPAIANLIVISGLETKMNAIKKQNAKRVAEVMSKQEGEKCVSFACKGSLVISDAPDYSVCNRCDIKVCAKCKCVYGRDHACKTSELESAAALAGIAKCPKCKAPAVRGEGCVFVTCPYCNVNFNSNSGEPTEYGGHTNGQLVRVERTSLVASIADPDLQRIVALIERAKPTKSASSHPAIRYERMVRDKLYKECVNLIYEYRDTGNLTVEVLKDMLIYVKHLSA